MTFSTRFGIRLHVELRQRDGRAPVGRPLRDALAVARAAEDGGFDAVWVPDDPERVAGPGSSATTFEAMTFLGALATATNSVRVGVLATVAGARPPGLLAKQVTTLDVLSQGRAVVGLRAPPRWPSRVGDPIEMVEEAVEVCRAMFGRDRATVQGRHFSVEDAVNRPQPPQGEGLPIVLLGGAQPVARLAVQHAEGLCLPGSGTLAARRLQTALAARDVGGRPSTSCVVLVGLRIHDPAWVAPGHARLLRQVGTWIERGADGVVLDVSSSVPPGVVGDAGRALCERFGHDAAAGTS